MSLNFLLVGSPYYSQIYEGLLRGASAALAERKVPYDIVEVPGALEIPAAIKIAATADLRMYNGFVALGCVIRGETTHYDYVCSESAHGLHMLMMTQGLAIGNGILTTETRDQAWVRADPEQKNKGRDAALAALSLAELKDKFGGPSQ